MAVYGMIQVALSVVKLSGKIMFCVCCNDHERNRERVHSELYSLGMCHAVWRNYMHMTHCHQVCLSVCAIINNNCLPSPPYHGRKVGCDLEGVPSNARVVGAGHTVHTW